MTSRRWLAVVRVMVIVLLTMAAADLFVPNLCGAEMTRRTGSSQAGSTQTDGDQDDCFCCCAHVDRVPLIVIVESTLLRTPVSVPPVEDLSAGVPRSLYHPPLYA